MPVRSCRHRARLLPILALAFFAVIVGCGDDDLNDPALADRSTVEPPSLAIAPADVTQPRPAPRLVISADVVRQGGVFTVEAEGEALREGLLRFGTHTLRFGERGGGLWAAVGVAIEEEPGLKEVVATFTDAAGTPHRLTGTVEVTVHDFPVDYVTLPPGVGARLTPELVAQEERLLQSTLRGYSAAPGPVAEFHLPLAGPVTTTFGEARVYDGRATASRDHHRGMDIGADQGAPVAAAAGGVVVLAQELPERGNYVLIDHGMGLFTGYGHLLELRVAKGDVVPAGATVGLVGSTGLSTGPHLHWDAVAQGVFFDPQELLHGALGSIRRTSAPGGIIPSLAADGSSRTGGSTRMR